jgi:osmoprotectant transport system ATP-binding protein
MDEPFGALDPITRDTLQDEVRRIQKKLKKTIVFVTHDMDEAIKMADVIVFMDSGRILQMASPEEMLRNPADPLIAEFMGKHMANTNMVVPRTTLTLQSIELMRNREVNTLLVVNDDDTYLGSVSIEKLRSEGRPGKEIGDMVSDEAPVVNVIDDARETFDKLMTSPSGYVVVLNDDSTVAGLITKTSMTKALGEALWGEMTS